MQHLVPSSSAKPSRDPRVDVFRGAALVMIFVDHMPNDVLNRITLHNFGFCDAAEVFVLLAGFSAMLAYGRSFERDGVAGGLRRIAMRCGRIYLFQAGLLLTSLLVVQGWTTHYHLQPTIMAPILGAPVSGLAHGLTLRALPNYLDILPLYVVLLAIFPIVYLGIRRSPWLGLLASAGVWAIAAVDPAVNLPNWLDDNGWYFDPFAWQFLFAIGAFLSVAVTRHGGVLPRRTWALWAACAYLAFAFIQAFPWHDWHLWDLSPLTMPFPDKSRLNWLRIIDVVALFYVVMSSTRMRRIAASRWLRPLEACGRHSLEVFAVGCLLALFGRLVFRTDGATLVTELTVNVVGIGVMFATGLWLEGRRPGARTPGPTRWIMAPHRSPTCH